MGENIEKGYRLPIDKGTILMIFSFIAFMGFWTSKVIEKDLPAYYLLQGPYMILIGLALLITRKWWYVSGYRRIREETANTTFTRLLVIGFTVASFLIVRFLINHYVVMPGVDPVKSALVFSLIAITIVAFYLYSRTSVIYFVAVAIGIAAATYTTLGAS